MKRLLIVNSVFIFMITVSQENSAPVVRITAPSDRGFFRWDAVINYSISVEDKEDGNSAYNEIAGNEVLLKVTYVADLSELRRNAALRAEARRFPAALTSMIRSNCLTCHQVKDKLIGPAFAQIAGRYPYSAAMVETLMKKVVSGSSGVWGEVQMPSHPDLNAGQLKEMIGWILRSSADPAVSYYTGLEGSLRTGAGPRKAAPRAVYVLTAGYTDHGLKDRPRASKSGTHTIVVRAAGGNER